MDDGGPKSCGKLRLADPGRLPLNGGWNNSDLAKAVKDRQQKLMDSLVTGLESVLVERGLSVRFLCMRVRV